jgi:N-acetylgalactosamine kinase
VDAKGFVAGDEGHVDESAMKLPSSVAVFAGKELTGEEGQEELLKLRCKLYTMVENEWKERATGDVKILKNSATGKVRVIVRQEKMHYLRCNHYIESELKPQHGTDRAVVWTATDFGMAPEGKVERFSLKLKDAEVLKEFKTVWDQSREANKAIKAGGSPPASSASAAVVDRSGPIPVAEELSEIYGAENAASQSSRYDACSAAFKAAYNADPEFFVRAPGRVNLIGEHIDYHGYSVLPMALQTQDVVIAVGFATSGSTTLVNNVNTGKYETGSLAIDPSVDVNRAVHKWYNYVHCGYKGAFDAAKLKGLPITEPKPLLFMIDGQVPPGAGVSSSSALVVASLLATARAFGFSEKMTRADLGEAGRACELHIGTMSGGMDQAISAMGEAGSASRVDFEPLKATAVLLPANAAFVVANTMEVSAKAEESERRYNMRVTEGKLAVKLVAKGEGYEQWKTVPTFRSLQEGMKLASPGLLLPAIEKHLSPGAKNQVELAAAFGVDLPSLFEGDDKRRGALKVLDAYKPDEPAFELLKRARHVCSEAERVYKFQENASIPGPDQLKRLGDLMCASQSSCRDDYECSSTGLDAVCKLAMESGAAGSRLTGAGWGGCAVSLVEKDKVTSFINTLRKGYEPYVGKDDAFLNVSSFASAPGRGAMVYSPRASFEV